MALQPQLHSRLSRIFNVLGEKEGRRFFYTAGANVCVIALCAGLLALFYTFQPFVRPLLWAALCGCVLHPLKKTCSRSTRRWLKDSKKSSGGLTLHVVLLPLQVAGRCVEALDGLVRRKWGMMVLGLGVALVLVVAQRCGGEFVVGLGDGVWRLLDVVYAGMDCLHAFHVWTIAACYFLVIIFRWTSDIPLLTHLSIPVWLLLIVWSTGFIQSKFYRLLTLSLALTLFLVGFFFVKHNTDDSSSESSSEEFDKKGADQPDEADSIIRRPSYRRQRSPKHRRIFAQLSVSFFEVAEDATDGASESSRLSGRYFVLLLWACAVMKLLQNLWLLLLLPIIFIIWVLYFVMIYFEVWERLWNKWMESEMRQRIAQWFDSRQDVLFPTPLLGVLQLIRAADRQAARLLEKWVDALTSLFVIGCVLVLLSSVAVLLVVQVHGEVVHLATGTRQLWNETVAQSPDIHSWMMTNLEQSGVQSALDSAVEKGYSFGREWITEKVHKMFSGHGMNTTKLENDLLFAYDKMYKKLWTDTNGTSVSFGGIEDLSAAWSAVYEDSLQLSDIISVLKENLDTLSAVLNSLWVLLATNISFALNVLTTTLWLVFTSGTTVLNFLISLIIFFTTLFYLLASPGEQYSLFRYIMALLPADSIAERKNSENAISKAVRGVFGAALKMTSFYGLFTWLIHTMFGIHVVFIPSAFAAVFAAIPFIGTYWVAVPGTVYLWLTGHEIYAAMFMVFHWLPISFVDTAIYGGIEGGGHPYITGLAIAGGIYWFGLEGAIVGPLLLCCILVALDIYHRYMDNSNDDESAPVHSTPRRPMLNRSVSAVEPGDVTYQ